MDDRPSFLLFVFDTTRQDDVSAYVPGADTTPNFDRLAREGVLYTRAIAQAPWTLPSHVSIFTGLLPSQHGVGWHSFQAPEQLHTLAEWLSEAGYQTLAVSENPWITPTFNLVQGFEDHFLGRRPGAASMEETIETWLRDRRRDRPFFVFVNVTDAHSPYDPGPSCDLLPPGVSLSQARSISSHPKDHNCVARPEAREMQILKALHQCALRRGDTKLGQVHQLLSSASENLISVVTSDHGELFGEDGLISHQFSLRRELLEVPLLVHGGIAEAPGRVDTPVQLTDIAPSILGWAGIDLPSHLDARPLPLGSADEEPRSIVSEYADYESLRADTPADHGVLRLAKDMRQFCDEEDRVFGDMRAVLQYPYKAIHYGQYEAQLFDIAVDPDESRDLGRSHEELALDLLARLPEAEPRSPDSTGAPPKPTPEILRSLEALGYLDASEEQGPE